MARKRLSPAALVALKEALSTIYWYKKDLRLFLSGCMRDARIVASLDWSDSYKRQVVADLVDLLAANQQKYLPDLTRLCYEVTNISDFSHLEKLEAGEDKASQARTAVGQLRQSVKPHIEVKEDEKAAFKRRREMQNSLVVQRAIRDKLDGLRLRFANMAANPNHQERGRDLESFMYDLFDLFELDPKASFTLEGEQIDGAFVLDGTHYLFEARWQAKVVETKDLDTFANKVTRRLENTLGVFLSINGFSSNSVRIHSSQQPNILLMDGADLMTVLEQRIDFGELLYRKKSHAARTSQIYLNARDIVG